MALPPDVRDGVEDVEVEADPTACGPPSTWRELSRLYALAAPLAVDQASSFCASIVAAAVVARLGSRPLAALFLGRSLITLTGMSPVLGSISAVETFSGAAHGAAERGASGTRAALGLVLQRALVLAAALSAGAAALWGTCARTLLVSVLGQDPGVAEPAARYVSLWAPALCLWGVSEACRRTAVVQGAVGACACVSVAVLAAAHPLTAAATRALGLDGADVADVGMAGLSAAGMAAVMLALDRGRQPGNRAWNGWSRAAMAGDAWRAHAGVAAPAAALICLIWWAGQATVLLAGRLPDPDPALGAAGVLLNVRAASFMLADGLAGAAAVRVANALGGGDAAAARTATRLAVASGAVVGAGVGAAMLAGVRAWAPLLCPDPATAALVVSAAAPLAAAMATDATAGALSGGLRGCGRQKTAALTALAGVWGVGLPLQAWLAFAAPAALPAALGPGVPGLMAGSALASAVQATALAVAVGRLDWSREAERAAHSIRRASGRLPSGLEPLLAVGGG